MSQNGTKTTSLMTSLTNNPQPPTKKFFLVQTRKLAKPFEPLNSSIAQSAEELWCWYGNRKLPVLGRYLGTNISYASSQSVNKSIGNLVSILKWNKWTKEDCFCCLYFICKNTDQLS